MANQFIANVAATWNNAGTTFHGIKLNVTNTASAADSNLLTLQIAGVDFFEVTKTGAVVAAGSLTGTSLLATANDSGALGASGTAFSDLFLASGGVINWNAADVTITHSANTLAFGGASSGYTFSHAVLPSANDGAALGASGTAWSDLFLASGGVINFNAGNMTLTHSAGALTIAGGSLSIGTSAAFTTGTIELGAASDTTLARSGAGVVTIEGVEIVTLSASQTLTNKTFTTPAMTSPTVTGNVAITSTDAGASAGPTIDLYRNSATPAALDELGGILFTGEDSAGNTETYARILAGIIDPTSTSEDGTLDVATVIAGTFATRLRIGAGAYTANATGGDKGADTINASNFYDDGVKLGFTQGTAVASTSGTAIDFTGIAAGAKRIIIHFAGVSTNGTSNLIVQIGDAGGIETTGYLGGALELEGSGQSTANPTTGFGVTAANTSSTVLHGTVTLTLMDAAAFTWAATAMVGHSDSGRVQVAGGTKSLSAELTQLRITTVAGADTFDAGLLNILYE